MTLMGLESIDVMVCHGFPAWLAFIRSWVGSSFGLSTCAYSTPEVPDHRAYDRGRVNWLGDFSQGWQHDVVFGGSIY